MARSCALIGSEKQVIVPFSSEMTVEKHLAPVQNPWIRANFVNPVDVFAVGQHAWSVTMVCE